MSTVERKKKITSYKKVLKEQRNNELKQISIELAETLNSSAVKQLTASDTIIKSTEKRCCRGKDPGGISETQSVR